MIEYEGVPVFKLAFYGVWYATMIEEGEEHIGQGESMEEAIEAAFVNLELFRERRAERQKEEDTCKLPPFPSWAFPRYETDMGTWIDPFLTQWECTACKETKDLSKVRYDSFGTWKFWCNKCQSETRVMCGYPQREWVTHLGVKNAERVALLAGLDKEMSFKAFQHGWQDAYNKVVNEHNERWS